MSSRDIRITTKLTRKNTLPPLAKNNTTRIRKSDKENVSYMEST